MRSRRVTSRAGRRSVIVSGALRFHDPLPAKFRQILLDRIRNAQLAFLGQHHGSQRHNRLRHGVNLEDRVSLDRLPGFQIGITHGIKRGHVPMTRDEGDNAGGSALIDELLHADRDLSEARGIQAGLGRIIVDDR